ncbi:MAG: hypothetical protein IJC43_02375 [Clostridia bacterium]|nr:hypothetical protein [Clostridia bacterium]
MKQSLKKLLALLLALVLCLSLVACGEEETPDPGVTGTGGESGTEGTDLPEDGLARGTGLEEGTATASLDANPDRAIRRSTIPIPQTVGTTFSGEKLTDEFYFYRNTLSGNNLKCYDLIRAAVLEGKSPINITVPVTVDDIFPIFCMVLYDSPEIFWAECNLNYSYNNYGNVTSITPIYNDLVTRRTEYTAALEESYREAFLDMATLQTDVEKAKYAHDYLTNVNNYVLGAPYNQTLWSSLMLQETVCAGYAKGFQYLMNKMGIPCAYVVGYAGENHAWNLVKLDSEFYMMDVTWDDPIGQQPASYRYDYFNITDRQIEVSHARRWPSTVLPAATATAASYQNAFGGNAYGTDFWSFPDHDLTAPPAEQQQPQEDDGGSSGTGGNPYIVIDDLPETDDTFDPDSYESDGDDDPDPDYYADDDYDWDDYDYDDYDVFGYDWWNALDEDWTFEDWSLLEDGVYEIWDDETSCWYLYDTNDGTFACLDEEGDFYFLDYDTGEWVYVG